MARSIDFSSLAETFVYGPLMLYQARGVRHPYLRAGLIVVGIGTVLWGLSKLGKPAESESQQGSQALGRIPIHRPTPASLRGARRRL